MFPPASHGRVARSVRGSATMKYLSTAPALSNFELKGWSTGTFPSPSLPFARIGGIWFLDLVGYNLSVATGVGFIALAGVAAEFGVVMLLYLKQAIAARLGAGSEVMSRIAAPMVGGMLTAPLLSMLVIPAAYLLMRRRRRAPGS
jgi:Cu(I)/Ag(I) efflux system membrane protein CusA/SilA